MTILDTLGTEPFLARKTFKTKKSYDADFLDNYYIDLVTFYSSQPVVTSISAEEMAINEFNGYLTKELIKNTTVNQINNRQKTYHRFKCHQFMIYALIVLSLLIIPFGTDFGINKGRDKVQKVRIESPIPLILTLQYKDTVERFNSKTSSNGKSNRKKTDTTAIITNKRRR
jgi:hypothetical protein